MRRRHLRPPRRNYLQSVSLRRNGRLQSRSRSGQHVRRRRGHGRCGRLLHRPCRRRRSSAMVPALQATCDAFAGRRVSRYSAPLLNTPADRQRRTQQLMQDQRTTSVQEALRNVPGITFTAGEGGVQGDQINIRGYTARNDIYRDGVRDPGWYARDAFSFDRVEVYKGPSSFAFGRGSTGGVINIVCKTAAERAISMLFEGTGTSAAGGRATVDVNKTLGDWAVRLSALAYETDIAGRDFANVKRYGFAPSVSYQINDTAKNTLSYIYQNDDNIADRGIPMLPGSYFGTSYRQPAPVPRNTYYGVATPGQNDVEQTEAHNLINKFEYEFVPGLKFTNTTGYSYVERFNRTRPVQLRPTPRRNLWTAAIGGTQLATPRQSADFCHAAQQYLDRQHQPFRKPDQQRADQQRQRSQREVRDRLSGAQCAGRRRGEPRESRTVPHRVWRRLSHQRRRTRPIRVRRSRPKDRRRRFPSPIRSASTSRTRSRSRSGLSCSAASASTISKPIRKAYTFNRGTGRWPAAERSLTARRSPLRRTCHPTTTSSRIARASSCIRRRIRASITCMAPRPIRRPNS